MEDLLLLKLLMLLILAIGCLGRHEQWWLSSTLLITNLQVVLISVAIGELHPVRLRAGKMLTNIATCETFI